MARAAKSSKKKKQSPYATKLDKLEAKLATAIDVEALVALAREFHSVNYSLGHDIEAIIDNPGIVDRATLGEVAAHERASAANVAAGNIRHALHHLFSGLDAFPGAADRQRLATRIVALLEGSSPVAATQLRGELAALPVASDETAARDQFYGVIRRFKDGLDWDRLPG